MQILSAEELIFGVLKQLKFWIYSELLDTSKGRKTPVIQRLLLSAVKIFLIVEG